MHLGERARQHSEVVTMKIRIQSSIVAFAALAALGLAPENASAAVLTCESAAPAPFERTWTLGDASACSTGPGNPNSSGDITGLGGSFAGETWTKRGDVAGIGDNSSLLDVALLNGTWGTQPADGTWTLASNFWSLYGSAVITIHVGGNPQQSPADFGAFRLTTGALTGTWSFSQIAGVEGGGLSNLSIWTAPCRGDCTPPTRVPEPGTLALMGLGLAGLGFARRRRALN
jgi:PEP-CTERM motif